MKRLFSIGAFVCVAAVFLLVGSCIQDPEADFAKPTVTASYSPGANFGEVILTCQVSNSYFKSCGFWYGTTSDLSDKQSLPVTAMSGKTGEARLTNLEGGRDYYFQAYVDGGLGIVTSGVSHFIIDDVMDVDAQGFSLNYPETDIHVKVETSLPITVDLGGANWITETQTKGLDIYNKVFHISRNTEVEDRSATIRIASTDGKFKKDIPVQQSGGPIPIPDANFKSYLVENFDQDGDGEITRKEALNVTKVSVCTDDIESLKGVEYFENITYLGCYGSYSTTAHGTIAQGHLTYLDLSNNKALTRLDCYYNQLSELDLSNNIVLTDLYCYTNQLTKLDVRNNTALTHLNCYDNQLTALDVSRNTALTGLYCGGNLLTALDINKNTVLTSLECYINQLTKLDVRNNTALTHLNCYDNQLTALDVSNNTGLFSLDCRYNQLTAIDVSNNTTLTILSCEYNQLTELDISKNAALSSLSCCHNQLTALEVSQNTNLGQLWCDNNQLTALDVSNNLELHELYCYDNQLTALDVSNNTWLTSLRCWRNQLTALDVSNNIELHELQCAHNQLTALDVSNNTALSYLDCSGNQLTTLDMSKNTALTELFCYDNQLTTLDVSNNTALNWLYCYGNPYLSVIWLKTGQTIQSFSYDSSVSQIRYKD